MNPVDTLLLADDVRVQKAVVATIGLIANGVKIRYVDPTAGYSGALEQVRKWRHGAGQRKLCLWHVGDGITNSWLSRRFFNEHVVVLRVLREVMSSKLRRIVMFGIASVIRRHWVSQLSVELKLPGVSSVEVTNLLASLFCGSYADESQMSEIYETSGRLQAEFVERHLRSPSRIGHWLSSNSTDQIKAHIQALNQFVRDRRLTEASQARDVATISRLLSAYASSPFHTQE